MTQNESCFNIFYFDWTNEVNLLVPPVHFLPKTIKRLDSNARSKKQNCSLWPSASFWALLAKNQNSYFIFIKSWYNICNVPKLHSGMGVLK